MNTCVGIVCYPLCWRLLPFQDGGSSDGRDGEDGARGENLLDITGAPGNEYLAPAERQLCSQLHMTPGPYLAVKVGVSFGICCFRDPG